MKKALSVILALAICLGMGAWTAPQAYDTYRAINEAMADVKALDMKVNGSIGIQAGGERVDILFGIDAKQLIVSETDVQMEVAVQAYLPGEDAITAKMYFKDGVMYQEVLGEKTAVVMDLEKAIEEMGLSNVEFERDAIQGASVRSVAQGQELSFQLSPEAVNKMVGTALNSMGEAGSAIQIDEISCVIVANDDNMMESYNVKMVASIGAFASMTYDFNSVIVGIDTFDSIDFPADLSSYAGAPEAPQVSAPAPAVTAPPATAVVTAPAAEAEVEADEEENEDLVLTVEDEKDAA